MFIPMIWTDRFDDMDDMFDDTFTDPFDDMISLVAAEPTKDEIESAKSIDRQRGARSYGESRSIRDGHAGRRSDGRSFLEHEPAFLHYRRAGIRIARLQMEFTQTTLGQTTAGHVAENARHLERVGLATTRNARRSRPSSDRVSNR